MTRSRICDVFSRRSRVSALFSALPAISAVRRLSHSTGKKIPATNYTFFYLYFRAEYRYPHGTAVPVWTPIHNYLSNEDIHIGYIYSTSSSLILASFSNALPQIPEELYYSWSLNNIYV